MTEPVAYGVIADGILVGIRFLRKYDHDKDCDLIPFYTSEQVNPETVKVVDE